MTKPKTTTNMYSELYIMKNTEKMKIIQTIYIISVQ